MPGLFFPGELYPDESVGAGIEVYRNVWPDPEGTISLIEEECQNTESGIDWAKAGVFGQDNNQNYRTNYDLGITFCAKQGNVVCQSVHNQMYTLLMAAIDPYKKHYGLEEDLWHEGYNILKYSTGQEYKKHYDGQTLTGRTVSAIIYLNDDFEGGEVEFVNFNVKIKPEPGMLILFPSNYPYSHIAHPVTSGTKYALVTWLADREV